MPGLDNMRLAVVFNATMSVTVGQQRFVVGFGGVKHEIIHRTS